MALRRSYFSSSVRLGSHWPRDFSCLMGLSKDSWMVLATLSHAQVQASSWFEDQSLGREERREASMHARNSPRFTGPSLTRCTMRRASTSHSSWTRAEFSRFETIGSKDSSTSAIQVPALFWKPMTPAFT